MFVRLQPISMGSPLPLPLRPAAVGDSVPKREMQRGRHGLRELEPDLTDGGREVP